MAHADWFRNALIERGISPCIPSRKGRLFHIPHDAALYRLRHRIENMFARLKDWRRIAKSRLLGARWPATYPPRLQRLPTMKPGEFLTTTNEI